MSSLPSSSRASTSRVSLEDWDTIAGLSASESASVSKVQARADERPLPARLAKPTGAHGSSSRPSTPTQAQTNAILRRGSHMNLNGITRSPNHSPRPASRAVATPAHGDSSDVDLLEIANPIETTQQFHDWFQRVEQSMEREQEEIYRTHLHEIDHYVNACDDVLEQLDDARGLLSEMEANYRFVEDNSRALQLACENMLDEQVRLYPAARRGCSAARTKSLILVISRRNT